MRTQNIIFALEDVFLNTTQSIKMSIKKKIKSYLSDSISYLNAENNWYLFLLIQNVSDVFRLNLKD